MTKVPPLRVLVDTPSWIIERNNTDWKYTRSLRLLESRIPVEVAMLHSVPDVIGEAIYSVRRRLGMTAMPEGRARWSASAADVIFSHRQFPRRSPIPVVWMYAVLDPEMMTANGTSRAEIERSYEALEPSFRDAAVVQLCTIGAQARHARIYGLPAAHFDPCPFYQPHIAPLTSEEVAAKHAASGPIRLLFVGHEARRKGLPNLLASIAALPRELRQRIELDVVSKLSDIARAALTMPGEATVRHHHALPRDQTNALFARAHIYAMPSLFESYGLTFVEASAAGCAVVAPDWEAQRDILDEGRSGMLVDPFAPITHALAQLIENVGERSRLALAARSQADLRFVPGKVAERYYGIFRRAQQSAPERR